MKGIVMEICNKCIFYIHKRCDAPLALLTNNGKPKGDTCISYSVIPDGVSREEARAAMFKVWQRILKEEFTPFALETRSLISSGSSRR